MESKSLTGSTGLIIFGNVFHSLVMLVIPIFLTRHISQDDFGTYRQVFLVYHTLLTVFVLGIPKSIYYFLPRIPKRQQGQFVGQSIFFLVLVGILIATIMLVFSYQISHAFNNDVLAKYLKIFSLYLIFVLPIQCYEPLMISINKHSLVMIQKIVFDLLFIFGIIIPVLYSLKLDSIFYTLVAVGFLNFVFFIFLIGKILSFHKISLDLLLFKKQLSYALPIGLSSIIIMLMNEIDKFMISGFFLPAQFAIYSIGARELPFVKNITFAVSGVTQPKFVEYFKKGDVGKFFGLWHRATRKTAILLYPIFFFFLFFADYFIVILYTDQYISSSLIFRIYLCTLPVRITSLGPILLAMGYPKEIIVSSSLALVSNIVLNILLILTIGFVGAAISTVIVIYINVVYLFFRIKKRTKTKIRKMLPWKIILKIFLVSFISIIIVLPFRIYFPATLFPLFAAFLCFCVCYISISLFLKIISWEELKEIVKIPRTMISKVNIHE